MDSDRQWGEKWKAAGHRLGRGWPAAASVQAWYNIDMALHDPKLSLIPLLSDPEEPACHSEAGRIKSHPARNGEVRIRCRLRKDRIRPNIDAVRTASDPGEPAYHSEAELIKSHPARNG